MVKIALRPLTEQEFSKILNSQFDSLLRGGALEDIDVFRVYRPSTLQGSGFLDIISKIGKFVLPAVKNIIAPAASEFAHNVIDDIMTGQSLKKTIKTRGVQGLKKIGSRILHGRGLKHKRKKHIKRLSNRKKTKKVGGSHRKKTKTQKSKCAKKKHSSRHVIKKVKYHDIFS